MRLPTAAFLLLPLSSIVAMRPGRGRQRNLQAHAVGLHTAWPLLDQVLTTVELRSQRPITPTCKASSGLLNTPHN